MALSPTSECKIRVPSIARGPPLLPAFSSSISPTPSPDCPAIEGRVRSLSPRELNVNRSVGLAKDPGELGKKGEPELKADPEGSGVMGKHGS